MRKSGPRSLSPSAGTNFTVLTLRLRVLIVPVKPFSVLVKVPMVAIVVFLFPIGPRQSRPRWWSFDRRRSDRTRRAQRQRLTAADGFFASRCKARHARRKKVGGGCCGKTIEAEPVFGQTQSIRGRRWTAQMEIIWNTTANNGISQKTTAALRWSQSPCPQWQGFRTPFSWRHRGPLAPHLRDAIVGVADDDRSPTK